MRRHFASSTIAAGVLAAAMFAASAAEAAFSTPVSLAPGGSQAGLVTPAAGPQVLAVWDGGTQYSFATETSGIWSTSTAIANALSSASCCTALHADGAGNATLVFSNSTNGVYTSDYSSGAWSAVAQLPSSSPFFVNGFSAFVENANADAAVVGSGSDFRAIRRTAGGAWGSPETIPMPTLAPNTTATIDNAAIGPSGELVVSFHVVEQDCEGQCGLMLYAAWEAQAGSGWQLSPGLFGHAQGTDLQSQPFIDGAGRAGIAYSTQFGSYAELRTVIQGHSGVWGHTRTLDKQPAVQGRHRVLFALGGVASDADGNATVVYMSHLPHRTGDQIRYVDGSAATNAWSPPVTLINNGPLNTPGMGLHFASNNVGGIVLAWDNVDAPIAVGARTQFGAQWQATGPVGPSSCGSPQATCTKVLALSIDDSGVQRILFDNDEATGMYFSQSL